MIELDRDIAYVRAFEIPEDAVFVVKAERRITVQQAEMIKEQFDEVFPGRKVLIMMPDLDLDVLVEANGSS